MKNANINNVYGIDVREIFASLRRSRKMIGMIVGITVLCFAVASIVLPKKYKSVGLLGIQTDYFRYPLIEEFAPSPQDINELSSRRDALIREALSDAFLENLGRELGLVKSPAGSPAAAVEIELMRGRFEYYPLSLTTTQIIFTGKTAKSTQESVDKTIAQITKVFAAQRRERIQHARDNIQMQIEAMALQQDPNSSLQALGKPELIQAEINRVEAETEMMRARLSAKHPTVLALVRRAETLKRNLKAAADEGALKSNAARMPMLVGGSPRKAFDEVYEGLVKKLAYLNVALDFESDGRAGYVTVLQPASYPMGASWPNRPLFVIWGLLVGLVIAGSVMLVLEFFVLNSTHGRRLAAKHELPVIGEMPTMILKVEDLKDFEPKNNDKKSLEQAI
jgi:cell fate (sporulation/competence/biofilm development) regulator YmcA (YheA/YmcA/DUF963 family)